MTFRSSIVKKTSTLLNKMIHITPECTMHLHGHQNKMVPLMKPFILVDLSNGTKFYNYTYSSTISHIRLVTTTLTTKTWSFRVM
jgi:hypothetical protein